MVGKHNRITAVDEKARRFCEHNNCLSRIVFDRLSVDDRELEDFTDRDQDKSMDFVHLFPLTADNDELRKIIERVMNLR